MWPTNMIISNISGAGGLKYFGASERLSSCAEPCTVGVGIFEICATERFLCPGYRACSSVLSRVHTPASSNNMLPWKPNSTHEAQAIKPACSYTSDFHTTPHSIAMLVITALKVLTFVLHVNALDPKVVLRRLLLLSGGAGDAGRYNCRASSDTTRSRTHLTKQTQW